MPVLEPTEKQIRCVNIIVNQLNIRPPTEFTKAAYSDFISEYMAESKKSLMRGVITQTLIPETHPALMILSVNFKS